MALTVTEAQAALDEFIAAYPSAAVLRYITGRREFDTFGILLADRNTIIRATYAAATTPKERGVIRMALERMENKERLTCALRHEFLGHWAIDTFYPNAKAAVLYSLMISRSQPGLVDLWERADRVYPHLSHMERAEEVWAMVAETVEPGYQPDSQRALTVFTETCIDRDRPMTIHDLRDIVCQVAAEIAAGHRQQRTYRAEGNQFASAEPRKPFRDEVAEELIEALKRGTAPWQKPWSSVDADAGLPRNTTTGKRYRGVNALHLMMQGRGDSRWMTYKQANSIGAQVRKGEKGTRIEYWQFEDERPRIGSDGRQVLGEDGRPLMERTKLERPRVFTAYVFNAEQIDGLPAQELPAYGWANHEKAEAILSGSGARIVHAGEDRAYYRPSTDEIHLPRRDQFTSASDYYAVALHELGHWTGHGSRLGRDLSHPFGSEGYAREELRAEIASMIIGRELGIGQDPSRHASYVGNWVQVLKEDPTEIFRAAAAAEKIYDYVIGLAQVQDEVAEVLVNEQNEVERTEGRAMGERVYVAVPETDIADAAALGGVYDSALKAWWFDGTNVPHSAYDRWPVRIGYDKDGQPIFQQLPSLGSGLTGEATTRVEGATPVADQRVYLSVPYTEKDEARALGARWDRAKSSWYVPPGVDAGLFVRWSERSQDTKPSAHEEFGEFLEGLGFVLDGHPIMDSRPHRAATIGDRDGARSGSYIGHLDGHPAGYGKNHRTGDEGRWKSLHAAVSSDSRGVFLADAEQRRAQRGREREEGYERAASKLAKRAAELLPGKAAETPYVRAKGIRVSGPLLTDETATTLYIPAFDVNGKMWSMQRVSADGQKEFAPGSRKTGCFFPVGGMEALASAPVIVIAEGIATAATVSEAVGYPTVAAFDAGNLRPVAEDLREKFPYKPIVIAGDDDRSLVLTLGKNVGREKATAAANAVSGTAVFPVFAENESGYPEHLSMITPASYKAHVSADKALKDGTHLSSEERDTLQGSLLSAEQLEAIGRMKRYTDWNDLSNHGRGGMAAVERQLSAAIKPLVTRGRASRAIETVAELTPENSMDAMVASRGNTRRM